MKTEIINRIIQFYYDSKDFNGIPYITLCKDFALQEDINIILAELINENRIEIIYGYKSANPHIKSFPDYNKTEQIEKLTRTFLYNANIYPSQETLSSTGYPFVKYKEKPYTLELALGAGQLEFRSFDLRILEVYRNDPRYYYYNNDISGSISINHEHYNEMRNGDRTILDSFGFSYNDNFERAVAVFLKYLNKFSSEHQKIWKSKELDGDYKLHPEYYNYSILGNWGERLSIFDAFIMEIGVINDMCLIMGKVPLFINTYKDSRPREFSFILFPTLKEYNSFALLLDKFLSENINKKIFKGDIELENEEERRDGKIVVSQKGTIKLLDQWINKYFKSIDSEPILNMIKTFKKVRKLRQPLAHTIEDNTFDQKYFKKQRELIIEAYNSIRTLRLIFASHPKVNNNPPKIDPFLFEGKIWDI